MNTGIPQVDTTIAGGGGHWVAWLKSLDTDPPLDLNRIAIPTVFDVDRASNTVTISHYLVLDEDGYPAIGADNCLATTEYVAQVHGKIPPFPAVQFHRCPACGARTGTSDAHGD
jgi:hypothetical protein